MDLRVLAASEGEEEGGGNFLVPNGTFLFELLAFLVILFILGRFVVPPIQRAMRQRREMVQQGIEDAQQARERTDATKKAYREELDAARAEGAKIREKARAEADQLAGDKREHAQQAVAGVHERGEKQLHAQRDRAASELREQVGGLALRLSERILGSSPVDDKRLQGLVDGFLADVPAGSGPAAEDERGGAAPAGTGSA